MSRLPRLAAITADTAGWGFFLCTAKELRASRSGSEFLIFTVQDVSAQITAKLFDEVTRFQGEFEAGEFVRAEGAATVYNGELQLVVSSIRRVNPEQDRLEGFREEDCVLSAPRPIDEMWTELTDRVRAVADNYLRVLLFRILADHEAQLREWPAAQIIHHAYRGGFLEHIVKMAEVGAFGGEGLRRERRPRAGRRDSSRHRQAPGTAVTKAARLATRGKGTWWGTSRSGSWWCAKRRRACRAFRSNCAPSSSISCCPTTDRASMARRLNRRPSRRSFSRLWTSSTRA